MLDDAFWNMEIEYMLTFFSGWLAKIYRAGLENGYVQLGVAVDWMLVNQAALEYARQYGFQLVSNITATTAQQTAVEFEKWIVSGEPQAELAKRIASIFGVARAELIASTEATRIFADANLRAWRERKIGKVKWQTAVDERVCPICGPLHNSVLSINNEIMPPAHPRCRCWLLPVVAE